MPKKKTKFKNIVLFQENDDGFVFTYDPNAEVLIMSGLGRTISRPWVLAAEKQEKLFTNSAARGRMGKQLKEKVLPHLRQKFARETAKNKPNDDMSWLES